MPVERHRCEDKETIARLRGELGRAEQELAMLRGRVLDLSRMVAAQQEGYEQALRDLPQQPPGRHRRPAATRWLKAVPGIAVLAARPARHKLLAGLAAASALVVVAAPQMSLAPWIGRAPHPPPSAVVQAFTPRQGGGGPAAPVPPPASTDPSGSPGPSPSPSPTAPAGTGTASPAPTDTATDPAAPDPTATDTPTADPTDSPTPDPTDTGTTAACPAPSKHEGR